MIACKNQHGGAGQKERDSCRQKGSEGGKEGSTDKAITRGWATDAHNETIRGPRARLFFFFFIPPLSPSSLHPRLHSATSSLTLTTPCSLYTTRPWPLAKLSTTGCALFIGTPLYCRISRPVNGPSPLWKAEGRQTRYMTPLVRGTVHIGLTVCMKNNSGLPVVLPPPLSLSLSLFLLPLPSSSLLPAEKEYL